MCGISPCVLFCMCVSKALWSHVRPTPTPHEEFQTFLEEEITALWERSPARSWHMVAKWSRQSRAPKHTQKEPWTPCTQCVLHRWECVSNYTGEIKEYPHSTARKNTHTQKVDLRIAPTKKLLNQNRQKSYQMLYYVKICIINVNPYPEWILQDIMGLIWKRQTEKVVYVELLCSYFNFHHQVVENLAYGEIS